MYASSEVYSGSAINQSSYHSQNYPGNAVDSNLVTYHASPYAAQNEVGGYRVKEEKARRLISWIEDAFMRKPMPPGPTAPAEVSRPIWTVGDAIARIKYCCSSDPHLHERNGLNMEIQDLKHRRWVASQLLDEVEEEIKEIQRCIQDCLQRRGTLAGAPRDGRGVEGLDNSSVQAGAVDIRSTLRDKLAVMETGIKKRDAELEKLYAALTARNVQPQPLREGGQQPLGNTERPLVPMLSRLSSVRGRRQISRVAMALDASLKKPHLQVALIHWRWLLQNRRYGDQLLLHMSVVLEACLQDKAHGVLEPLLHKLLMLRSQTQPPDNSEILGVWDWANGEISHRGKGNALFPARSQAGLQRSLNESRRLPSDRVRKTRLVRIFMRVFRQHEHMFLHFLFVGWTWTCSRLHTRHEQQSYSPGIQNWMQAPLGSTTVRDASSGRTAATANAGSWFDPRDSGRPAATTNSGSWFNFWQSTPAEAANASAKPSTSGFGSFWHSSPEPNRGQETTSIARNDVDSYLGPCSLDVMPPSASYGSQGSDEYEQLDAQQNPYGPPLSHQNRLPMDSHHSGTAALLPQRPMGPSVAPLRPHDATARMHTDPHYNREVDQYGGALDMGFDDNSVLPPPPNEEPARAPRQAAAKSMSQVPMRDGAPARSTPQVPMRDGAAAKSTSQVPMRDGAAGKVSAKAGGPKAKSANPGRQTSPASAQSQMAMVPPSSSPSGLGAGPGPMGPEGRVGTTAQGASLGIPKTKAKAKSKQRPPSKPLTFTIFLDKASGASLGLEVTQDERDNVIIQAVTGGLAMQWNMENPDAKIEVGDRIVEVNGVHEPGEMLDRCRIEDMLMMTLERLTAV